jgi:hypothetical protein
VDKWSDLSGGQSANSYEVLRPPAADFFNTPNGDADPGYFPYGHRLFSAENAEITGAIHRLGPWAPRERLISRSDWVGRGKRGGDRAAKHVVAAAKSNQNSLSYLSDTVCAMVGRILACC